MKKVTKIVGRVALAMLIGLYVAVAALNYSVVQSYVGTYVGQKFSQQWGGELHIGSLHAMPWDHLLMDNVWMVAPDGDTILDVKHIRVHFKHFPYSPMHLEIDRVSLRDGYYHLAVTHDTLTDLYYTNLQHIIDYYTSGDSIVPTDVKFTVDVHHLNVSHLRYRQDLPEEDIPTWDEGVDIAHMDFRDINIRAKNIHVVNDDVSVKLLKLSTTEKSGMRVDHAEADVHVSPHDITVQHFALRTPTSTVLADVEMLWDGWGGNGDYLGNVRHNIELHHGTQIDLSDAAYWAPILWGIQAQIEAEGHVKGTIADMHISDFAAHWGSNSALQLTGDIVGLPDIEHTIFDIDIERLHTDERDIRNLGITSSVDSKPTAHYATLDLSELLLRQIAYIDLSMRLHGGIEELGTVNLLMESGLGELHADALLTPSPSGPIVFTAEMGSSGLGLRMLNTDWLSHTGFDLSIAGTMGSLDNIATLNAELDGQLINSVVRGKHLSPIEVAGAMRQGDSKLRIHSTDSIALFTLEAVASLFDTVKSATIMLDAENIDAYAMGLLPEAYGQLSTRTSVHLAGTSPDEMEGSLRMMDSRMGSISITHVAIDVDAADHEKQIRLESDAFDATVGGRFDYLDLPLIAMHTAREALPADLFRVDTLYPHELEQIEQSNINFHIHWHDREQVLGVWLPTLNIANGTHADGSYNYAEGIKLVLRSDSINAGEVKMQGVGLIGRRMGGNYQLSLETQDLHLGTTPLMQDATILLLTNTDSSSLQLTWDSETHRSQGDLMLHLADGRVSVVRPNFTVGATPWQLSIDDLRIASSPTLHLSGNGVGLHSADQDLSASIDITGSSTDNIELQFNHFELDEMSQLLLQQSTMSLGGKVNGRFSLYGINEVPYFYANLTIDNGNFNQHEIGDIRLRSSWNAELNTINLQLDNDAIAADGWIELGAPHPALGFSVDIDRFDLSLIAPMMGDFSSRFEGMLHGNFDITGTTATPLVVGEALIDDGVLQIDLTGVTYYFSDSIQLNNNLITLHNFAIHDPLGNMAIINGAIDYENLDNINLDMQLHTDRLQVLNRSTGDEFYGTLTVAADGTVSGPIQALEVGLNARTAPGCTLTVPVNDQRQVKAQNYITFAGNETSVSSSTPKTNRNNNIKLEVDLSITPDAQLNLPMDFSEITVGVAANGVGDIHMSMEGNQEPLVVGNYELSAGTVKVNAISIISKTFTLEEGSNLQFQGSLPDARFDLSAVYSQRVNLSTLTGSLSEVGGSQKYLQVENVINIAGSLTDPSIGFDLRLPGADASVEEEVFAYIDRNSERDMLNQTVSLLVSGHFYNVNNSSLSSNIATSGGIGALSSLLTDMVSVVNIDVDYKAGNELTKDQVDFNISKDWGRWYLESTLGYGGESRELQTSNANTAVIDALIGYRLSPLVHLFSYNRTNTNDYTRMDLPYKQGIGLKLTKDFDQWGDLFKKK